MRFNIVSECGDGMGLGVRLLSEDNEVRLWIMDDDASEIGDELVPKVGSFHDLIRDAKAEQDVFVCDTSGFGIHADWLRQQGFAVLGASSVAERLEQDREYGTETMRSCGIRVPQTFAFESFEDAKNFVREFEGRLVYKPSKMLGDLSMSHVSYDKKDMLKLLEKVEEETPLAKPEFSLQEFLEGTCISSEGWFDGEKFLPLFNHTLERKELMNDNLGPSGGCTGNVVWACDGCDICRAGIFRVGDFLRRHSYIGMIDLNTIVTENEEVCGLEWTPRFGYDASPTLLFAMLDGEVGRFISDTARRQFGASSPRLRESQFAAGLRVTIPPWPSEKFHADKNIPIRGLRREDLDSAYLYNVKRDADSKELASAGAWGIIACLVGRGSTIARAFGGPYEVVRRLKVPNLQYRTDLIKQFKDDLQKLGGMADEEAA